MFEQIKARIKRIKQNISEVVSAISYRVKATVSFLLLALATLWAAVTQTPLATNGDINAQGQAGTPNSRLVCNRGNAYCALGHSGAYIDLYSDKGSTRKFYADGATGNVAANLLTATNLSVGSGNITAYNLSATALTMGAESFSGAVSFGTIGANDMVDWGPLAPRYSTTFSHGLGAIPSSCIVAGATDVNSKLASVYDLTTTTGRVVVSTQGQVFWICSK
jgi:hypothetical protein